VQRATTLPDGDGAASPRRAIGDGVQTYAYVRQARPQRHVVVAAALGRRLHGGLRSGATSIGGNAYDPVREATVFGSFDGQGKLAASHIFEHDDEGQR
jgi:hypothetical protein